MAKHGIKGLISAAAEQFTWQWAHDYRDASARHGRELQLGQDLALGFRIYVDDTVEKAMRSARPYFEEHVKFAAPLGMLRYSEEQIRAVSSRVAQAPGRASLENGVQTRVWLCGPAEEIVPYLQEIEEKYPGLEQIMVSCGWATPKEVLKEQLTRFAKQVMPAFMNRDGS